jgi:hypothetical protein
MLPACPLTPSAEDEGIICESDSIAFMVDFANHDEYRGYYEQFTDEEVAAMDFDTRPEGTVGDLDNCKTIYDVYEVVCTGGAEEEEADPCNEYEKKPCRREHDDVCKWSHTLKECQSIDWTPVCSDYTLYMQECKKFSNEGYACEWKNKECKATDVEHECVVGWKEVEVLKGKSDKTKHKYLATLQDCQDKAVEVGAEGFIYEENHKKQVCLTFDTVDDYHPGTSADTELQIYYHETC